MGLEDFMNVKKIIERHATPHKKLNGFDKNA